MKKIFMVTFLLSVFYTAFAQRDFSSDFYIYNAKGKLKSTIHYDLVKRGSGDFLIVAKDGKYGVYDYKKQKVTIDLKYRDIDVVFKNGLALAKNKNEKWGLVDVNTNEIVLPFEYYKIYYLSNQYYCVTKFDRKWGVYDVLAKAFTIPCQFDSRMGLQDELFVVKHKGQYGLYGKQGEIIMPFQKQGFKLNPKVHIVQIYRNNRTLLFNSQSLKYQTELEFENYPLKFIQNYAAVQQNKKWSFLHNSGKLLMDFQFEEISDFNKYGYAKVKQKGRWGVIDTNGQFVIANTYITKSKCPEVKYNGIYLERIEEDLEGVKRLDGTWLIPPEYYFFFIKEGYITAQKKDNSFFLFDINGNLLKSTSSGESIEPVGSLYRYYNNEKFGWMNQKFKVIAEPGTAFLNDFEHPKLATVFVDSDKKYGAVNAKGKIIIPIVYEYIWTFDIKHGIVFVKSADEKWGAFNLKGKAIIPTKYSRKIHLKDGWSVLTE